MSVIAKSETIQLLFHFQMQDIFFTVRSFITTSGFSIGFQCFVQISVTVLFVRYRKESS